MTEEYLILISNNVVVTLKDNMTMEEVENLLGKEHTEQLDARTNCIIWIYSFFINNKQTNKYSIGFKQKKLFWATRMKI